MFMKIDIDLKCIIHKYLMEDKKTINYNLGLLL